jgi:hypothetical protein
MLPVDISPQTALTVSLPVASYLIRPLTIIVETRNNFNVFLMLEQYGEERQVQYLLV